MFINILYWNMWQPISIKEYKKTVLVVSATFIDINVS